MNRPILEICAGSLTAVEEAQTGGADRVELCSGLAEGGLTPSVGLIESAVGTGMAVNVLIRPRPGDFLYSRDELKLMVKDVETAMYHGANGIVIGALTQYGDLDKYLLKTLMKHALMINTDCDFTLHRAFDLSRDPLATLRQAAELGFDRVLTSGCAPTAIKGKEMLRWLRTEGEKLNINIMAGGGVNAENARELAEVADELHASARRSQNSAMIWRRPGIAMGGGATDEYLRCETDRREISDILQALR